MSTPSMESTQAPGPRRSPRKTVIVAAAISLIALVACTIVVWRINQNSALPVPKLSWRNRFPAPMEEFSQTVVSKVAIYGGKSTRPGEWPWQAILQKTNTAESCGAVLLSDEWVAAAAHCVVNHETGLVIPAAPTWKLRFAVHDRKVPRKEEIEVKVGKIFKYASDAPFTFETADLALIKLSKKIPLSSIDVSPIRLPSPTDNFESMRCVLTGWGETSPSGNESSILQQVDVLIRPNAACAEAYQDELKITLQPWHLCAGTFGGKQGPCDGDSGSPLQCLKDNGRWYLAGIVSLGIECAEYPAIYARAAYFARWIRSIMENN